MALRTVGVIRSGQPDCSAMIGVARGARRRKGLRNVMRSPVMAGHALLVDDFLIVKP